MSLELLVIICLVSTVAGTISAGIRYYAKSQKKGQSGEGDGKEKKIE